MVGLSQSQGCQQEPWACHLPLVGEVTDQDVACVEEFDSHPEEMGACEEWWGLELVARIVRSPFIVSHLLRVVVVMLLVNRVGMVGNLVLKWLSVVGVIVVVAEEALEVGVRNFVPWCW